MFNKLCLKALNKLILKIGKSILKVALQFCNLIFTNIAKIFIISRSFAEVAELVDAADSKSAASDSVRVRVPPSAPFLKKISCPIFYPRYE